VATPLDPSAALKDDFVALEETAVAAELALPASTPTPALATEELL
jgi:hypothetical protein